MVKAKYDGGCGRATVGKPRDLTCQDHTLSPSCTRYCPPGFYPFLSVMYDNVLIYLKATITNSDINSPCFSWHPCGKLGLLKTE